MAGWDTQKPIYDRLPGENEGYRKDEAWEGYNPEIDPPIARWLTEFFDELLVASKGKADCFHPDYLNPLTCQPDALDWLAMLCGFTGEYWVAAWPVSIKRQLIQRSFEFIWIRKGTRELLNWLFALFGLQVQIYLLGEFLAGITQVPAPVGGTPFQYYLLVKLIYLRTSPEWALIDRLNRLYGPVYCESQICYDQFYAGFSLTGDPVF